MIVFKCVLCFEFLILNGFIFKNIGSLNLKSNNSSSDLNNKICNLYGHFILGHNLIILLQQNQSAKLAIIISDDIFPVLVLDERMQPRNRDIRNSDIRIMPSALFCRYFTSFIGSSAIMWTTYRPWGRSLSFDRVSRMK